MKKFTILMLMLSALANGQVRNNNFNNTTKKSQKLKLVESGDLDNTELGITGLKFKKTLNSNSLIKEEQTLHLDSLTTVSLNVDGIYQKVRRIYNSSGSTTLYFIYNWASELEKFIPSTKEESTYNSNGNTILSITYSWDSEKEELIPSSKYEYAYDSNQYLTLSLQYNWDTTKESFVPSSKRESEYDDNGRLKESINYNWDSVKGELVPSNKYEIKYNSDGFIEEDIQYNWDSVKGELVPFLRNEFTYDAIGNQILSKHFIWDGEKAEFLINYKNEYTYDAIGNQTMSLRFNLSSEVEFFYPTQRTISEVDNKQRVMSTNGFSLNICNNEKINDSRVEYSFIEGLQGNYRKNFILNNGELVFSFESGSFYNEDGRTVLRSQNVNTDLFSSNYNWKSEYTYDDNGNQTLYISYNWDTSNAELIPKYKIESTYDEENNRKNHTYLNWFKDLGVYKGSYKQDYTVNLDSDTKFVREANLSEYDINFNTWNALTDEKYKSYWYYSKVSSLNTESIQKEVSIVYPNPTSNFIKVRLTEQLNKPMLELFDVTGKQVLSKSITTDINIDISKLKPAIYFYKIKEGKEVKKSGKIIKVNDSSKN